MKRLLVTIDDKACKDLHIDLKELIKNYVKGKDLFTGCPPTIGMKITMEGLELEASKLEKKDKFKNLTADKQEEFIKDYLLHKAFAKMFNLAHLVTDVEILENEE